MSGNAGEGMNSAGFSGKKRKTFAGVSLGETGRG